MKIIFLDIDGVLINEQCRANGFQSAHPACVKALNWLTHQSGASLVVTSTWRIRGYEYIQSAFRRWHIDGEIIGMTPMLEFKPNSVWIGAGREFEIRGWCERYLQHPLAERLEYVILDDEPRLIGSLSDRLVQTTYHDGLTMEKARQALALFFPRIEVP